MKYIFKQLGVYFIFLLTLVSCAIGLLAWLFPDIANHYKIIILLAVLSASLFCCVVHSIYTRRNQEDDNNKLKELYEKEKTDLSQKNNYLTERFNKERHRISKYELLFEVILREINTAISNSHPERWKNLYKTISEIYIKIYSEESGEHD